MWITFDSSVLTKDSRSMVHNCWVTSRNCHTSLLNHVGRRWTFVSQFVTNKHSVWMLDWWLSIFKAALLIDSKDCLFKIVLLDLFVLLHSCGPFSQHELIQMWIKRNTNESFKNSVQTIFFKRRFGFQLLIPVQSPHFWYKTSSVNCWLVFYPATHPGGVGASARRAVTLWSYIPYSKCWFEMNLMGPIVHASTTVSIIVQHCIRAPLCMLVLEHQCAL